eukprot:1150295-Pelagomonas_calceolata.AAC.6
MNKREKSVLPRELTLLGLARGFMLILQRATTFHIATLHQYGSAYQICVNTQTNITARVGSEASHAVMSKQAH